MRITAASLIACTAFLTMACTKHDYCNPTPPKPEQGCDLAQVLETSTYEDDPYTRTRFRKEYDPATGKVKRVMLGLFQLQLEDSINMNVTYQGNDMYFLSESNPGDTVIVASFNSAGRLLKLTQGNAPNDRLLTAAFAYGVTRLSSITIYDYSSSTPFSFTLTAQYDANGNVTQLAEGEEGTGEGFIYTYDLGVAATDQFYSDDFIGDSYNSLFFAEFMGWLPDLMPVNKRTSSRIALSDDQTLYSASLNSHVYDGDKKLISYQLSESLTFTNVWNCNANTDSHANSRNNDERTCNSH